MKIGFGLTMSLARGQGETPVDEVSLEDGSGVILLESGDSILLE